MLAGARPGAPLWRTRLCQQPGPPRLRSLTPSRPGSSCRVKSSISHVCKSHVCTEAGQGPLSGPCLHLGAQEWVSFSCLVQGCCPRLEPCKGKESGVSDLISQPGNNLFCQTQWQANPRPTRGRSQLFPPKRGCALTLVKNTVPSHVLPCHEKPIFSKDLLTPNWRGEHAA